MKRERLLPLIVATALFIENMDSTAIATSLPAIAQDFGVEPVALKLALTTYMLALAVFIPISGWVADRFGARPTFMTAIGVFLLGSIGCAASDSSIMNSPRMKFQNVPTEEHPPNAKQASISSGRAWFERKRKAGKCMRRRNG